MNDFIRVPPNTPREPSTNAPAGDPGMYPDFVTADLLDRYFTGNCTPDEISRLHRWADTLPNGDVRLETLRRVNAIDDHASWDLDTRWLEVQQRIGPPTASGIRKAHTDHTSLRLAQGSSRWYRLAAGVGAAILLVAGWSVVSRTSTQDPHAVDSRAIRSTYTTPNGQRAAITLPDGSHVILNAGSQLNVPADFSAEHRVLELQGEALFTVDHHRGRPFTVISGPSTTRVLGTRFMVRHYATDTAAVVAVQDGKVSVHDNVITAHQEIVVSSNGRNLVRPALASRFNFERGILSLEGSTLREIIPDLNRWFDAEVQLGDPQLADRRIEGDYGPGTAGTLAEILELTFNIRVVRNGRMLTLYPRG